MPVEDRSLKSFIAGGVAGGVEAGALTLERKPSEFLVVEPALALQPEEPGLLDAVRLVQ